MGERYLSTPLFADVPVDMSEEELEISRSLDLAEFCVEPAFPAALARSRSAERGIPPPANSATPR